MLRDTDAFDLSATPIPFRAAPCGTEAVAERVATTTDPRSIEQEIMKLTWAVLDGGATLADRQRLAELVNAQHSQRRRCDR